jgi:hypothetical protein
LRVSFTDAEKMLVQDEFLMLVDKARTDGKTREELDQGVHAICHDFTQYYNKAAEGSSETARL